MDDGTEFQCVNDATGETRFCTEAEFAAMQGQGWRRVDDADDAAAKDEGK